MAREVLFRVDDRTPVLDRMAELADGSGWMVFDAVRGRGRHPAARGLRRALHREGPGGA